MSESNGIKPKLDAHAVIESIMDHPGLSQLERIVAIKVLRHRREHTGACFPGLREIGTAAGISHVAAKKILEKLDKKGILTTVRGHQWEKYGMGTNQYFFRADLHLFHLLEDVPDHIKNAAKNLENGVNQSGV